MAQQQQSATNIRYFTKDTLLASWLYMNGTKLDEVTKENPCQLIFQATQNDLDHLINEFNEGNPHGNIITFFRSYKYLLAQIMER